MRFRPRTLMHVTLVLLATAGAARAQTGWGLAPDGRGGFTFSDITRDRVWHMDSRGQLRLLLEHVHCHTLVPGYDGAIYGEDVGGGSRAGGLLGVWKLAPDGRRIDLLPVTLTPDPSVWLVRDAAGNSFAWEGNPEDRRTSRILRRSPDGVVTILTGSEWGSADGGAAEARFGQVQALTVTADGVLYLVDEGHLRTVLRDGSVTTSARDFVALAAGGLPARGGLWNHSMGAAVDASQRVYVVDYSRHRIVRFDATEGAREIHRSAGIANRVTGGSWGWRPTGVAFAGGEVFVMEDWPLPPLLAGLVGSPRILRIALDGSAETIAAVSSTGMRIAVSAALAVIVLLLFRLFRHRRVRRLALRHAAA